VSASSQLDAAVATRKVRTGVHYRTGTGTGPGMQRPLHALDTRQPRSTCARNERVKREVFTSTLDESMLGAAVSVQQQRATSMKARSNDVTRNTNQTRTL